MNRKSRAAAALCAFSLFVPQAVLGASASAAPAVGSVVSPYSPNAKVTVSTTRPRRGATITVQVSGYKPGEVVELRVKAKILKSKKTKKKPARFKTKSQLIRGVKTDSIGSRTARLTLPRKFRCAGTIRANADESDTRTKANIFIGKRKNCTRNAKR